MCFLPVLESCLQLHTKTLQVLFCHGPGLLGTYRLVYLENKNPLKISMKFSCKYLTKICMKIMQIGITFRQFLDDNDDDNDDK